MFVREMTCHHSVTYRLVVESVLAPCHHVEHVEQLLVERVNAVQHGEVGVFAASPTAASARQVGREGFQEAATFVVNARVALWRRTTKTGGGQHSPRELFAANQNKKHEAGLRVEIRTQTVEQCLNTTPSLACPEMASQFGRSQRTET